MSFLPVVLTGRPAIRIEDTTLLDSAGEPIFSTEPRLGRPVVPDLKSGARFALQLTRRNGRSDSNGFSRAVRTS
jgi:hypothetical protein